MIINHNIAALNTHRQMGSAQSAQMNSMEKLSSGLRINSAKDDAAGLSISEKMRGQIRGLEQASTNAQDGISMIQTAEGALSETQDILQRMREVSTQAANGTLTDADRGAIQDEMNQLTSEINRIGNTTEFNTQGLLKGDGGIDLAKTGFVANTAAVGNTSHIEATATTTVTTAAAANDTFTLQFGGKEFTHTFTATPIDADATGAELRTALTNFINNDESLKGQFEVTGTNGAVTLEAVDGKTFEGSKGQISSATTTGTIVVSTEAGVGTTTHASATTAIDFSSIVKADGSNIDKAATTKAIEDLVGKGFEINGTKVEFYNVNDGAYKGDALGVDISKALDAVDIAQTTMAAGAGGIQDAFTKAVADQIDDKIADTVVTMGAAGALTVTSTTKGPDAKVEVSDGAKQESFKTSFQIGANTGQALALEINDMRANALKITGKAGESGFTATNGVTNGTNDVKSEASLSLMTKEGASTAIKVLDDAIASVSSERSKMGATQNRLEHTINNLNTSSENLTAAESRIRDVDMAKEMMEQTKNSILAQASQAMLAQSNQMTQSVLQLLR